MPKEFADVSDPFNVSLEERKNKLERSNSMRFDESYHTKDRAKWIVDLFLELDHFIMNLKTGIRKEYLETYIKFSYSGLLFCYILIRKGEILRVWAKVPYSDLGGSMPLFIRDYSAVNRRQGVIIIFDNEREFKDNRETMLAVTFSILKQALKNIAGRKRKIKTPLKPEEPVKQIEKIRPSSINILAGENGYLSINLKIHKSQKELLNRILQETILK